MHFNSRQLLVSSILALAAVGCSKPAAPTPELQEPAPASNTNAAAPAAPADTANPAAAAAAPAASSEIITETVYFDFDSATLTGKTQDILRNLAQTVKSNPGVKIQIEGHCDERGSNEYNLALGERRARSIQEFLISDGLSTTDLSTISFGEERPVENGSGESSWAKNRRGEFKRM